MAHSRPGTTASTGSMGGGSGRVAGETYLFGIPIGGLGWFATLLLGAAAGFAAFFAGTFFGILGLMVVNMAGHANVSYADSYKLVGLPLGVLVLVVSMTVLVALRIRRMARERA